MPTSSTFFKRLLLLLPLPPGEGRGEGRFKKGLFADPCLAKFALTPTLSQREGEKKALLVSLWLILYCFPALSPAEVSVSLPLEGHYRPGRYMPVRLTVSNEPAAVMLTARGAVPTELTGTGNGDVIIPWLPVTETMRDVRWTSSSSGEHPISLALHALTEHERLVGLAGGDPGIVSALFPEKKIISVLLDAGRPLDPPLAWETLDAVVFSSPALARLDESARQVFASAGTALAVQTDERPDRLLPWERFGGYWVLRHRARGPASVLDETAYVPTYGWERSWPAPFRRTVIFAGIMFCILATGTTLLRPRYAFAWGAILCALAGGLFVGWYSRQSPVLVLEQGVVIADYRTSQYDLWTWQSALRPADSSFPAERLTHPIFATSRQPDSMNLRLVCDGQGRPIRFAFHLEANQSLACLTRYLSPAPLPEKLAPAAPGLRDFAADLYLRPGDRIAGHFTGETQTGHPFPLVVIRRAEP